MAVDIREQGFERFQSLREGMSYDAEGVSLIGRFADELSAYRAKKSWIEILNSYFLLEQERDYDIWVTSVAEANYFVLSCTFSSACGRYAFWRLINHQAPEAEQRLCATGLTDKKERNVRREQNVRSERNDSCEPQTSLSGDWQSSYLQNKMPWVVTDLEQQLNNVEENKGLISILKKLFSQ